MDHTNLYTYSYPQERQRSPTATSSRQSGAYQNSSAFSASANPDEDWTKISDLAERRRIQNRIAQRNYRKKLKKRLEDLEKRTSSVSPEQTPREVVKGTSNPLQTSDRMQRKTSRSSAESYEAQYSPDLLAPSDEYWSEGRPPATSPYSVSYPASAPYPYSSSIPASVDYFPNDCQPSNYPSHALYGMSSCQQAYLQGSSPSLPSMMGSPGGHQESQYTAGSMMNGFDVNYASLTGGNIQASPGYTARTPPLTDSASHLSGNSRECSPSFYNGPLTPDSRSVSPNLLFFQA